MRTRLVLDNCCMRDLVDIFLMIIFRGEKTADRVQNQEKKMDFADVPYEGALQTWFLSTCFYNFEVD